MDLATRILNLVNFALIVALDEIVREAEALGKTPVELIEATIAQTAKNDTLAAALLEKYKAEIG
jgi:hypothetical protein